MSGFDCLKPRRVPRKAGFTLVEILAVLTIIAVLIGMVGSALGGFGAQKLSTGGTMLTTALHEARAIALGETTMTRLAVNAEASDENYMRAFTILRWERAVDSDGRVSGSWVQTKPWVELPDEIVFENGKPAYVSGYKTYGGDNWTDTNGNYFTDNAVYLTEQLAGGIDYVFVEFKPSGNAAVYLLNEEKSGERNVHIILKEAIQGNTIKNWVHVVTDSLSGRVKLYRP